MHDSVLISIHPRFVESILSGEKTVEFRRRWTSRQVDQLVIYATSPVKKIVAVVAIEGIEKASPSALWKLAKQAGGGISRKELMAYFEGLDRGFGIRLGSVHVLKSPIDPYGKFQGFRAPQSFRSLRVEEVRHIQRSPRWF